MGNKPIYVTEPFLPPLEDFVPYLQEIWQSKILTNGGQMHQRLEAALARHLEVPYVALFNNGTNALITALQALDLSGEVITTPYSFVATAHSLLWNRLVPVFVDIDPATFNLDPDRMEAAITPQTAAILPVHCYGAACDVERLGDIGRRHGLPVVYDAAHAFDVRFNGRSLLQHGDLSVLSFHATKVFNTFEGGAIVCHDSALKQRIDRLKNFGIVDESTIDAVGLNGKMNEVQSAFGLLQLEHVRSAIAARREIAGLYRQLLAGVRGVTVPPADPAVESNASYFPVLIEPEFPEERDALYLRLRERGIHARRYFFPLLSDLPMYSGLPSAAPGNLPNARRAAQRVLCLPIYPGLSQAQVGGIVDSIAG